MTDPNVAYLALGRLIAGQCPPGFTKASLGAEILDTVTRVWIEATQADGWDVHLQPSEEAAQQMLELLRGIRARMAEEDGRAWQRCTVTLAPGGGFALDVEYDEDDD